LTLLNLLHQDSRNGIAEDIVEETEENSWHHPAPLLLSHPLIEDNREETEYPCNKEHKRQMILKDNLIQTRSERTCGTLLKYIARNWSK
jgi:hypothetical protein